MSPRSANSDILACAECALFFCIMRHIKNCTFTTRRIVLLVPVGDELARGSHADTSSKLWVPFWTVELALAEQKGVQ
jgi:hypothetical protein